MARKNPFANLQDESKTGENRPALDYAMMGASRSILSSIDEMAARADKLTEGETIIELHPEIVDVSFIQDRLAPNDQEFSELVEAIRERGQDSPILVRPHPSRVGRYMVVFGHRRLMAAKLLGRTVRSIVKEMGDQQHAIAQGQENAARANLSFIEKVFFAANLARLNYDSDNATILAALAIDRTTLSKLLAVAGLPAELLQAIGPAKAIGRDRWYELKLLLENPVGLAAAKRLMAEASFANLSSDERFNTLIVRIKLGKSPAKARPSVQKRNWMPNDGLLAAEITADGKKFTLAMKSRGSDAKAFGEYLSANLDQFYEVFRQDVKPIGNGD